MRIDGPHAELIHVLRSACSGELAAGYAYRGHWKSISPGAVRERIREIEEEEWHHRRLVRSLLVKLGSGPSRSREAVFWMIGKAIGLLCHIGGRFIPMYGAGRLESANIAEYERAAAFALAVGYLEMVDCLLTMAEVEWEHERFFREQIAEHWMLRIFKPWPLPPPKHTIRSPYAEIQTGAAERKMAEVAIPNDLR
ncbi:MAG TPA: demethoxyubiquinone hydroxylase family protein [Vicinamibacterales bacterium]|nr:demethoxyubiquinone hydroxylase family protein [Vicinamibacterales bacterium]